MPYFQHFTLNGDPDNSIIVIQNCLNPTLFARLKQVMMEMPKLDEAKGPEGKDMDNSFHNQGVIGVTTTLTPEQVKSHHY